jgi:hypothetical protein
MILAELAAGALSTFSVEKIQALEQELSRLPQLTPEQRPVRHIFAPGVYLREIFLPAGVCVTGKIHLYDHAVMVLGDVSIYSQDGGLVRVTGCETFVSSAGVKRAVVTHSDTWFTTVHPNPTNERDLDKLAAMFTVDDYAQLPGTLQ